MKLSDIFFPLQNGLIEFCWFLSTMLTFNQSHTVIFTCAADDFQKSRKNAIFENCIKNLSFEKK